MMKTRKILAGIVAPLAILACSAHPEPIIDERGVDMVAYEADLESLLKNPKVL